MRTLEQILQDMLGAQAMTIAKLQAQLDLARAELAALKKGSHV